MSTGGGAKKELELKQFQENIESKYQMKINV